MVAAAIALAALTTAFGAFLWNMSSRNEEIAGKLSTETESVHDTIEQHIRDIDRYGSTPSDARASVPALRGVIERQNGEIIGLSNKVLKMQSELDIIKLKLCDRNRPDIKCP
jgi:hypothetical protein